MSWLHCYTYSRRSFNARQSTPRRSYEELQALPRTRRVRGVLEVGSRPKRKKRNSRAWFALQASHTPCGNVKPDCIHKEIGGIGEVSSCQGRVLIVGDVHGCADEFDELLQKVNWTPQDLVILLGDLVDLGPQSARVVRKAREMGAFAVRGNHDDAALRAYSLLRRNPHHPLKKMHSWVSDLSKEDAEWLSELPFSIRIPSRRCLLVHAGLIPGLPLHDQGMYAMYRMKNEVHQAPDVTASAGSVSEAISDNKEWRAALNDPQNPKKAWAAGWTGPDHVFFGHDADRGLQLHQHATGLDTGCAFGGSLTACILPSENSLLFPREAPLSSGRSIGTNAAAPTLAELNAEIISVPVARSQQQFSGTSSDSTPKWKNDGLLYDHPQDASADDDDGTPLRPNRWKPHNSLPLRLVRRNR